MPKNQVEVMDTKLRELRSEGERKARRTGFTPEIVTEMSRDGTMGPPQRSWRGAVGARKDSNAGGGPNSGMLPRGRAIPVRRLASRVQPGRPAYPVGWTRQGKDPRTRRIRVILFLEAAKRNVNLRLKRDSRAPSSSRW
jgi:hypothetical protein